MISDLFFHLRAAFRRQSVEEELDAELRSHLEHDTEKLMATGLSPEEASRRARLAFGGLEQVKEVCRDARGIGLLDDLRADIRGCSNPRKESCIRLYGDPDARAGHRSKYGTVYPDQSAVAAANPCSGSLQPLSGAWLRTQMVGIQKVLGPRVSRHRSRRQCLR
jgi:hypothetical protein